MGAVMERVTRALFQAAFWAQTLQLVVENPARPLPEYPLHGGQVYIPDKTPTITN